MDRKSASTINLQGGLSHVGPHLNAARGRRRQVEAGGGAGVSLRHAFPGPAGTLAGARRAVARRRAHAV